MFRKWGIAKIQIKTFSTLINIRDEPARSSCSLATYFSNGWKNTSFKFLHNTDIGFKIMYQFLNKVSWIVTLYNVGRKWIFAFFSKMSRYNIRTTYLQNLIVSHKMTSQELSESLEVWFEKLFSCGIKLIFLVKSTDSYLSFTENRAGTGLVCLVHDVRAPISNRY